MSTDTAKHEDDPPVAPTKPRGAVDRFFGITKNGSNYATEIRAGITTFLAMSYVIFVNPSVLSDAIVIPGVDNVFQQLVMVTCMAAILGSLYMGLIARYPFMQAPGMGLNAFFTYTVVLGMDYTWQEALAAVFISGVLFVALSVIGLREAIARSLSTSMKYAITAGIGAFLAFLGMKNAGFIIANEATFVGVGDVADAHVWLALIGLLIIVALMKLKVKGAILWGIIATTVIGIAFRLPVYEGADGYAAFAGFGDGIVAAPIWPSDLAFQMDFAGVLSTGLLTVIFTFFFVDFFDATGTLTGLSQRSGYMDEHGNMPRAKTLFSMDGLAAMSGAALGTSTTTAYVESAAGVEEGGRTGLTAVTGAALFLVAMFFSPLIAAVPGSATAPALILVGALMMEGMRHVQWDDISESVPAFLTVVTMPFTFSIAEGVSIGIISYALIKLCTGRVKDAHWIVYILAALLLVRWVWLA
ncbi:MULTISPECIES: NCS2 family permease [unclassified Pseudactinotalea]|uniref:NCS2 family permease n=1 Tax=unclassified Pseudactinotalea TaxID=2649176 RepID=UPI00128B20EA|nr:MULTISPECIES: NCS2 family permease [unclassified Pseudactinotalea]MPV48703.1 NCS2 family permease [Pseudactinotalea sp. HY160]QGH68668.1 NCS2 family permease [Pseudactinotalea sp. HY158]